MHKFKYKFIILIFLTYTNLHIIKKLIFLLWLSDRLNELIRHAQQNDTLRYLKRYLIILDL
jgi:hypothetical protein